MTSKEQGAVWLSARCLGPDCYNFAIRENRKFKFALREKNTVEAASKIVGIMGCSQELGVLGYLMNTGACRQAMFAGTTLLIHR